ncbi:MAG: dynamin family protein [Anaerolineales bacterium]|nr:MAG: dynamin family protein [Anaerolineales bacterium]
MLRRILTNQQERLLTDERRWLGDLRVTLARFDVAPEDQVTLDHSIGQLVELFLLVVVGEFNSGKSAFINALLGQPVLEEGVTPTTTRINLLKHGPATERTVSGASIDVITASVDLLREINIVDTPGTNAIHRQHEAITQEFVPRSDMVLFVTSADRPFTESERAFLQRIRDWGKKVVVVVNKIDILETPEDVARIETFIADNARTLLGFTPEIFPVSARQALRAKLSGNGSDLLTASRLETLERYIAATLDEKERIRLKLLNPLGVGAHLVSKYQEVIGEQLALLKDDFTTIEDIEGQLGVYKEDMTRDFRYRLADVENVLHEFESRGIEFFDETMRLARILDLINKSKLKVDFERKVVSDAPKIIEQRVTQVIDWMVSSDLRQWQAAMDHLSRRRAKHAGRIVGQVGGSFDYDRARLLDTVGRAAQRTLESYDKEAEAAQLAESVQRAVAGTALVEIGAIGLGTIVTIVATSTLADVTGILAASTVAVLGLFVIPARRREAKKELREKIGTMRQRLMNALTGQFERELERSLQRINEAIAPYTRFIRAERDRLAETRSELNRIQEGLARLKAEIEAL